MAEVTSGGSDAVAVDIEVFQDCVSQQNSVSSPTTSEDEQEGIAFRREDLDPNWVSSIKGMIPLEPEIIKLSSGSKSCSIHRFPSWLRQQNSTGYEPKVISIGPLHYKKRYKELRAMEEHKWKYLHDIVSRKHEDEGWLEDCLVAVKRLEERARNCYSEEIPLDSDSFVEMMVLDACFILEFFRRFYHDDCNDIIFRFPFLTKALHFDLLLLENQIPFFILERVYLLIDDDSSRSHPLVGGALNFFLPYNMTEVGILNASNITIQHLLHLLHTSCIGSDKIYTVSCPIPRIPCASELEKVGIKFRKRDVFESGFLDIRFDNGLIEIPYIPILENTMEIDRKFLNLVAFEQCYPHCRQYVTSYAIFMNYLINSGKDVKILCRKGIIMDGPRNKELVPNHFDNMTKGLMMNYEDFYLSDVCEKINMYSKRTTPKLRASFKSYLRGYFKNPWAIISFSAAVLLLLFTATQTFFTAFPKFADGN